MFLRVLVNAILGKQTINVCVMADLIKYPLMPELSCFQRIQKDAIVIIPSLENCIKGQTREVNLFCLSDLVSMFLYCTCS